MTYIYKVYSLALYLSLFLLSACGVRELPEDGGVDPTVVHTSIVLLPGADMTPFDVPEFSTRSADGRAYNVRYQVEVYAVTIVWGYGATSYRFLMSVGPTTTSISLLISPP